MDLDIVICGDALEVLGTIPANAADMVLTDPPYGIASEVVITRGRNKMKFRGPDISHNFGEWDKFDDEECYWAFTTNWADKVNNVLRPGGMFCSWFDRDKINFLGRYLQKQFGYKLKGYYADLKSNPVPQARKVKWMNGWEIVGLWQKPGGKLTYRYELGQQKDWGIRPIVGGKERKDHPTQKPLSVCMLFVEYWTEPGDVVIDPFAGTGTTLTAAKLLGRRYIGIESEPRYAEIARERLAQQTLLSQGVA